MRPAYLFVVLTLLVNCLRGAPFLPSLRVEVIEVSDLDACSELIGPLNVAMRDAHQVPLFLRIYDSSSIPGGAGDAFVLYPSGSFEGVEANRQRFAQDPALAELRSDFEAVVSAGAPSFLQGVRFDGTHAPGWLCNFWLGEEDEAVVLAQVERLRAYLREDLSAPPFLNVFRVVGGSLEASYLLSLNVGTAEELGLVARRLVTPDGGALLRPLNPLQGSLYRELGY